MQAVQSQSDPGFHMVQEVQRLRARLAARLGISGDVSLVIAVAALVAIGIAMVFSTSYPLADAWRSHDSFYLLKRHLVYAAVAAIAFFLGTRFTSQGIRRRADWLLLASTVLLAGLFVAGKRVNGSLSWYPLGPFNFQPSEFTKFVVVVVLARYFAARPQGIKSWKQLKSPLIVLGVTLILIAAEPDMGTAAVIFLSTLVFLNTCGVPTRRIAAMMGVCVLLGAMMVAAKPYQLRRIKDFINPEKSASKGSYQTTRSLVALGSGGIPGLGYCQGREKYFYLPASYTDSILAVTGEEKGLLGTWAVLGLLALVVWRGFAISRAQPDRFASLLAAGIACFVAVQALINIAVVTGSIPATGVTLPFISYGGSSLIVIMLQMGVLAGLSRNKPELLPAEVRRAGPGRATPLDREAR